MAWLLTRRALEPLPINQLCAERGRLKSFTSSNSSIPPRGFRARARETNRARFWHEHRHTIHSNAEPRSIAYLW